MTAAGETAKARIDDWLERLSQETDQAAHSAAFQAYLTAMGRFWKYSPSNVILIMSQGADNDSLVFGPFDNNWGGGLLGGS